MACPFFPLPFKFKAKNRNVKVSRMAAVAAIFDTLTFLIFYFSDGPEGPSQASLGNFSRISIRPQSDRSRTSLLSAKAGVLIYFPVVSPCSVVVRCGCRWGRSSLGSRRTRCCLVATKWLCGVYPVVTPGCGSAARFPGPVPMLETLRVVRRNLPKSSSGSAG